MTERPEPPDPIGVPTAGAPPAGPPPYPYSYPPGPAGQFGPQSPAGYLDAQTRFSPPPGYPAGYPQQSLPYGDYQYTGALAPAPRNGLGTAALVLAIVGLVGSCSVVGGLVLGVSAIILGIMGRGRVQRGEATNGGVATTGIILGTVAVLISVALLMFGVRIFNQYGGREMLSCIQDAGDDNDLVQQCMDEFQQRVESQTGSTGR